LSAGQHVGTDSEPLPLLVSTSADGASTWSSRQLSSADGTGSGPSAWGLSGCTVRTDSRGTVYVFVELTNNRAIAGRPGQGANSPTSARDARVMFKSTDGGATWSNPLTLFSVTDTCELVDPLSLRCIMDGYTGARTDLGSAPSVDIANGAPTGADATNMIIDAWCDATGGVKHEQARVSW
jgi:hypothetical protein